MNKISSAFSRPFCCQPGGCLVRIVAFDRKEFERVTGLELESWIAMQQWEKCSSRTSFSDLKIVPSLAHVKQAQTSRIAYN
jgi:hypothetical protein